MRTYITYENKWLPPEVHSKFLEIFFPFDFHSRFSGIFGWMVHFSETGLISGFSETFPRKFPYHLFPLRKFRTFWVNGDRLVFFFNRVFYGAISQRNLRRTLIARKVLCHISNICYSKLMQRIFHPHFRVIGVNLCVFRWLCSGTSKSTFT